MIGVGVVAGDGVTVGDGVLATVAVGTGEGVAATVAIGTGGAQQGGGPGGCATAPEMILIAP